MSVTARVIVVIASLLMTAVLFLPIWKIHLIAPQYPEGLTMKIWANKLTGDIDIINGLNHYIGMRTLHNEDFPEFKILPFIIIGFAILGIVVALLNRRILFRWHAALFLLIATVSMADFYRWEYEYGHDLDPKAPIQVPGLSYQPPLIGGKKLLNFMAYSYPDFGGYIFALCGVLIVGWAVVEWWKEKKLSSAKPGSKAASFFLLFLLGGLNACSQAPVPIQLGEDGCSHCKMTIVNPRFAAEIVTQKGKPYKFDDVSCLVAFLDKGNELKTSSGEKISGIYVADFSGNHSLVKAEECQFLQSEKFRSPMRGDIAAFSHPDSLNTIRQAMQGSPLSWKEVLASLE